ncbi:MAG: tetratricopeptide repeat protein [Devosia sp.]
MKRLWSRFGVYIIAVAVLIVVLTAGYRGYVAWNTSRERAAGDEFIAAATAAETTRTPSSAEALQEFADDAPGGYGMLARFLAATTFHQAEQTEQAIGLLRELEADSGVPQIYRDLAHIRLAQILIDEGDAAAARQEVAALAEDTNNPWSQSAQELMGLAAYMDDDVAEARRWYTRLQEAAESPPDLRQRAQVMLALMAQSAPAETDVTPAEETN